MGRCFGGFFKYIYLCMKISNQYFSLNVIITWLLDSIDQEKERKDPGRRNVSELVETGQLWNSSRISAAPG